MGNVAWKIVLDPFTRSYVKGFDPSRMYQFRRGNDGEVQSFRLSETNPYFNVAGLYWRDPFAAITAGTRSAETRSRLRP